MRKYDLICGISFLIVAVIVFIDSVRLGISSLGAGTFSLLLAIILSVFSIVLIVNFFRRKSETEAPKWPAKQGTHNILFMVFATAFFNFALKEIEGR